MKRDDLTRFAWLSIAAALVTMILKGAAYYVTGSVSLFSDALESLVNLAAALVALAMLSVAARPARSYRGPVIVPRQASWSLTAPGGTPVTNDP